MLVPKIAPMEVAVASANRALSILEWKPALVSMAFSSSSEKMPVRRPVPMKVPMVSKVSVMLKAKIVISTRGILAASVNREGRPAWVKMAPKVVGSCWQDSVKLMELLTVVTPMGMPTTAVATMPNEDSAGHLAYQQDNGQDQADEEQPDSGVVQDSQSRYAGIKVHEAHIQEADISHKDADTAANGVLEALGNGFNDELADLGHGDGGC